MIPRYEAGVPLGPFGFTPREAGEGRAVWDYVVAPAHYNINGTLHGGVLMSLLDTAMGHAVAAAVAPAGRFNAAAQFNIHFLVPVTEGRVHATATIKKLGKRLAVVEAEAVDDTGRVLALATATHSLLP
jgi:uncharacterized protein (TIGR00369 family)